VDRLPLSAETLRLVTQIQPKRATVRAAPKSRGTYFRPRPLSSEQGKQQNIGIVGFFEKSGDLRQKAHPAADERP
jgi:hypothetical protein